ncbi:MAG: DNA-binding protein, partial [Prevotella sp.]|nr:DNA-binding protein [Prevotella sp.]
YVYGIGAKGDFEKLGLKEGDVVTLVGKRAAHNGNAQVGGAQYESHISVTDVTIAEFLTKEDNSKVFYRVTGTVDEIANTTYGNLYLKDGDSRVYVYGCYPGWGATGDFRKNCIADKDIAVGDKLTVIGVKGTHNGTTQVANGIYFSHVKAN